MKNIIFLKDAIKHIPQIICLADKNKFSPTYGCFDRNFWHYKTIDFPTGMAQLGVLSLALVYSNKFDEYKNISGNNDEKIINPWYKNERIKELIISGIKYMPKCSHKDGTTDEFYPFERALGATSFSLIAATEAYLMMDLDEKDIVEFFKKRGDWMINNAEPAPIANHLAGAALALVNIYLITKDRKYLNGAKKKIRETIALINPEGWFQEYDGCDVGYLTFTIDYVAKYYKKTNDKSVLPILKKAIEFCSYFIHPDGSFAGEYGSRNTGHFLPAGFQLMTKEIELSEAILSQYRTGFSKGKQEYMNDEKYFFYNVNNYMQAYLFELQEIKDLENQELKLSRNSRMTRDAILPVLPCFGNDFFKYFEQAKIYVIKKKDIYCVVSVAKGGIIKIFKNTKLTYSFTGLIGKTNDNKIITTQLFGGTDEETIKENRIHIKGNFQKVFFKLQTTENFFLLRSLMLTLGRSWKIGRFIKHFLVKKLITKKKILPISYDFEFLIQEKIASLRIIIDTKDTQITDLYETSDLALIQVPTSRYYQEVNLHKWLRIKTNNKSVIVFNKTIQL
ncbi:MAG: hypothetical protein QXG00_01265 [Candidatus Woesearchaeota archaeon]